MKQDGIKRASIEKLKSRFETAYYSEDMVITPLVMFRELDDLTAGGKPKAVRYIKSAEIELLSDIDERTDVDGQRGPSFPMKIRCIAGGITVRC